MNELAWGTNNDLNDNQAYINSNLNRVGYSFSYISDKNIGTIDYECKKVSLMYDSINPKNISYVHHSDLHSSRKEEQKTYMTNKINEIRIPNHLIAYTNGYNEIVINGNNILPKALICYDEITTDDILFANKYHLSILLINSKKYRRSDAEYEGFYDNTYCI